MHNKVRENSPLYRLGKGLHEAQNHSGWCSKENNYHSINQS